MIVRQKFWVQCIWFKNQHEWAFCKLWYLFKINARIFFLLSCALILTLNAIKMIYAILILAVLPVHDCLQCLLFCIWVDWPKILLSQNHRHRKPPAHHRAAHPLPVRFAGYPPYLFPWKSIHEQANCSWIFVIFQLKKKSLPKIIKFFVCSSKKKSIFEVKKQINKK